MEELSKDLNETKYNFNKDYKEDSKYIEFLEKKINEMKLKDETLENVEEKINKLRKDELSETRINRIDNEKYIMKDKYNANDLYIGKLFVGIDSDFPFLISKNGVVLEQKYIFEKIDDNNYREIFTGFITEEWPELSVYRGIPYIFEPVKYIEYFPETYNKEMSKINLLVSLSFIRDKDIKNEKRKILKKEGI